MMSILMKSNKQLLVHKRLFFFFHLEFKHKERPLRVQQKLHELNSLK